MADEIEIPVLVKTPKAPDGSVSGVFNFSKVWGKFYRTVMTNPWVLAAVAVAAFFYKGVSSWQKREASVNSLSQALINQGIYTRDLANQYQEMARAIQKNTSFSEQEVTAAQSAMQSFMGDKVITNRLMMAVVDFAAKTGKDLTTAATMVGKTIGTSTNALVKFNVVVDETASKDKKTDTVILALESSSGGQAEAVVKGLGAVDQMWNSLNGVMEVVGKALSPFIIMLAEEVARLANALIVAGKTLEIIPAALEKMELGTAILKTTLAQAVDHLSILISSRAKAVADIFKGNFSAASKRLIDGDREIGIALLRNKDEFNSLQLSILDKKAKRESEKVKSELSLVKKNTASKAEISSNHASKKIDIFKTRSDKDMVDEKARLHLRNDRAFIAINKKLSTEKDETERLKLEIEKRRMYEDALRKAEGRSAEKKAFLDKLSDEKEENIARRGVALQLAEMQKSKIGALVLVGKAAAIAEIYISTTLAIAQAEVALSGIAPPLGPALATAFGSFLALYGEEQIKNIINSDIDNPGRIGELQFDIESILESVWGYAGRNYESAGRLIEELYGTSGDLISDAGQVLDDFLSENLGVVGEALGWYGGAIGDAYGKMYNAIGDLYGFVYGTAGRALGAVAEKLAQVIGDVAGAIGEAIGDAAEAVFGWLFAEGGSVTHVGGSPVVTPLHQSGIRFGLQANVTIVGGLVPSVREAKRIASIIHKGMGS